MSSMSSRQQIYLISTLLISVGLGLTLYKYFFLHFPLTPDSVRTVWTIEAKMSFDAHKDEITADLALPGNQNHFEILDETFASSGYDFVVETRGQQRRAIWRDKKASGPQELYYSVQVTPRLTDERKLLPLEKPATKPSKPTWSPAQREAAQGLIQRLRAGNQPFVPALLRLLNEDQSADDVYLLTSTSNGTSTQIASKLLAEAGIASHLLRGVHLRKRTHNDPPVELLEVHENGVWTVYHPETAEAGLPEDFFVWQRGGPSLLDVLGGRNSKIRFSVLANVIPAKNIALKLAKERTVALVDFNIYSLPVEKQNTFKMLLMVPLGALVVVFFKIMIGLRTSGTFMPVLIALAFIQTTLLMGIGILVLLVATGLWMRSYLSRMDLHMAARLAAVLIIVVVLMAGFSVASHKLEMDKALAVTFFPMVILAWTIERMSILWEEEGPREVLVQGGGSLLVAVFAYLVMTNDLLEHLTFNFPELLLGVLGIIMLMGQYTGFRLLEFRRFRHLDRN